MKEFIRLPISCFMSVACNLVLYFTTFLISSNVAGFSATYKQLFPTPSVHQSRHHIGKNAQVLIFWIHIASNKVSLTTIFRSRRHIYYKCLRLLSVPWNNQSEFFQICWTSWQLQLKIKWSNFHLTVLYKYHSLFNCYTLYAINELTN